VLDADLDVPATRALDMHSYGAPPSETTVPVVATSGADHDQVGDTYTAEADPHSLINGSPRVKRGSIQTVLPAVGRTERNSIVGETVVDESVEHDAGGYGVEQVDDKFAVSRAEADSARRRRTSASSSSSVEKVAPGPYGVERDGNEPYAAELHAGERYSSDNDHRVALAGETETPVAGDTTGTPITGMRRSSSMRRNGRSKSEGRSKSFFSCCTSSKDPSKKGVKSEKKRRTKHETPGV
jgi:hypothetical protein